MYCRHLIALLFLALSIPLSVAQAQAPAFTDSQKGVLQEIIKDYLLKNPEVVQDAMIELEKRQKDNEQKARSRITQDKSGPLFTAKHNVSFGNPKGDVTIVEFFDYNCGFCKRALVDLQRMVAEDKNVRIITKDFPVLGQGSVEAATVAVAAKQQLNSEKLWAFHQKMLTIRGQVGKQQALDAAKEVGADMAKLAKDMESSAVRTAIEENVQIADALGLTGTPSYLVGDDIVVGAVGFDNLKSRVDSIRKCGKSAC